MPRGKKKGNSPNIPANRLRQLREEAGLTQEEVGRLIGVSHAAVNRWEHRINSISNRYLMELSKVLRCHPGEILLAMPGEERLTPAQRRVRKLTESWDDEALEQLLQIAEMLKLARARKSN